MEYETVFSPLGWNKCNYCNEGGRDACILIAFDFWGLVAMHAQDVFCRFCPVCLTGRIFYSWTD